MATDNIIKLSGLQRFKENADAIYGKVKKVQGISPDSTGNVTIPEATSSKSGLLSAADKSTIASLSTVATSGSYTDLKDVPTKVSQFTNDSNYITSSARITGNAATATALTTNAGSTTRPIYFKDGKPVETGYTLACDVPAGAIFTDTNTKVTNTLATTTKAYITGTTSSTTGTGTQVFDTGVYLDTTAGQLTATTFKGNLNGTASKATADASGNTITSTYATKTELTNGLAGKLDSTATATAASKTTGTLTVQYNGTSAGTFNGSANTTINIPAAVTGAADADCTYGVVKLYGPSVTSGTSVDGSFNIAGMHQFTNKNYLRLSAETATAPDKYTFSLGTTANDAKTIQTCSLKTNFSGGLQSGGTTVSVEGHTHNYAGSSSAGGAATSANKINTDAGSATNPVYFANGVPVKTTYTLGKSVPSDAVFTDTVYTHPSYTAKTSGLYKITVDATGHVSAATAVAKADITALGIPAQDTVYTLPTASSTLGGVKTTSTVSDASGYTACPIISGVPYYKDTNNTYTLSSFGITATAAELNVLDGITATVTELNYCDGVTSNIQTQLNGKLSTSGTAAAASKLSVNGGSATQPIYFVDGVPTACTYTLGKSVPSDAKFTDTNTKVTNTLATTTKAYITGTTSATTNTGTQVFDTGVYLDTTAGKLTATTFNGTTGALSGNLTVGGTITATGTITGSAVYNAVYNDYAEFFPRGEETEAGDIIMLDLESNEEKYVKAYDVKDSNIHILIAGVHSDEYAHLIGGENPPEGEDFVSYNIKNYIPVGLAGRCHVKIKGKAIKGAPVVLSDVPGVGICCTDSNISTNKIVGYLVESDDKEDIRRLKIRLK